MSPRLHGLPAVGAAAVLAVLTACSSGGATPGSTGTTSAAVPSSSELATVCADDAGESKALPTGWPADFPLPDGLIVTSAEDRGTGGLVVQGVTAADFPDVLAGLQQDLPAAGFTPDAGEVEPDDAESNWESAEYEGRWAIRELSQCEGDTAVSVLARHT